MYKRKDGRFAEKITLPNGKAKFFYSKEKTESKAKKDIQNQMISFKETADRGKLFTEVADEWFVAKYDDLSYSTQIRYNTYVSTAKKYFNNYLIKKITADKIQRVIDDMVFLNYSVKTITDQLSIIKQIFRYALMKEYIDKDISQFIKIKGGKKSIKREALTDDEIDIIKNNIDCTFGLLAYFLLYTGLRKGEALALQWKDIDFENKIISISKSVYFESNNPRLKLPKTASGVRKVILLDNLSKKLKKGKQDDFVFNRNGALIDKTYFTRQWEKYQQETGLKITAHQLRHTYATILFEAGIPEKDTQALMGHSDIKTTQNIYTHIRQKRMDETANKLNTFLSGQ